MKNKIRKGNYYRLKTRKWLERDGFKVANLEVSQRIFTKDNKVIFVKRDLWGGDLIASNGKELVVVQSKADKGDISKGIRALREAPWPGFVKKWVIVWAPGSREPEVIEA